MRTRVIGAFVVLAALRCSQAKDAAGDHLKKIASWDASAVMIGEEWTQKRAPSQYSSDSLKGFLEGIDVEQKSLRMMKDVPQADRTRDDALAAQSFALVRELARVVEKGDRSAARDVGSRLAEVGERSRIAGQSGTQ